MNILIANDDGIKARGIHELANTLSEIADVYISAPDSQRSASGHGITMGREIFVKEETFEGAKKAYSVSGTPADCVKLGIELYRSEGIEMDIVFSGINHGSNLGTDVLYSGTVSAALEGRIKGLPAVAVSVKSDNPEHFEYAARLAAEVALKVYESKEKRYVISINAPNIPATDVKGVKTAYLGVKLYDEVYEPAGERDGGRLFIYGGDEIKLEENTLETDVGLIDAGYATITPLGLDLTEYKTMDTATEWCAELDGKIIF